MGPLRGVAFAYTYLIGWFVLTRLSGPRTFLRRSPPRAFADRLRLVTRVAPAATCDSLFVPAHPHMRVSPVSVRR